MPTYRSKAERTADLAVLAHQVSKFTFYRATMSPYETNYPPLQGRLDCLEVEKVESQWDAILRLYRKLVLSVH